MRHLLDLEREAERGYIEQVRNDDMLHQGEREEKQKREGKKNASLDLQNYIMTQMADKVEQDAERKHRSSGGVHVVNAAAAARAKAVAAALEAVAAAARGRGHGVQTGARPRGGADTPARRRRP